MTCVICSIYQTHFLSLCSSVVDPIRPLTATPPTRPTSPRYSSRQQHNQPRRLHSRNREICSDKWGQLLTRTVIAQQPRAQRVQQRTVVNMKFNAICHLSRQVSIHSAFERGTASIEFTAFVDWPCAMHRIRDARRRAGGSSVAAVPPAAVSCARIPPIRDAPTHA